MAAIWKDDVSIVEFMWNLMRIIVVSSPFHNLICSLVQISDEIFQPKTVHQGEQWVHSHPFYKVSGRGRVAYLILCLEEVLLFYEQDFSVWERILRL